MDSRDPRLAATAHLSMGLLSHSHTDQTEIAYFQNVLRELIVSIQSFLVTWIQSVLIGEPVTNIVFAYEYLSVICSQLA